MLCTTLGGNVVRYRARLVRTLMKNSMHNVKINANPFTEDFIEKLKGIGDPKIS
ncbi:MAG: hypothetical protein QXW72_07140 [Conexivisphaerales archaeon]